MPWRPRCVSEDRGVPQGGRKDEQGVMSDTADTHQPFDIVIIGGGPGGYVAAIRAAQLGGRVALVERDALGGTCLNRGCIPAKAMVRDAELFRDIVGGQFGVVVDGARVDYPKLVARRRAVVRTVIDGVSRLMKSHRIAVYRGHGRILAPDRVRVSGV